MLATYTLIALNCVIYFLHYYVFYAPEFSLVFGLNALIFNGAWWQVISTMFLHGSLMHLLMNMVVLFQFGTLIERGIGSIKFCFLYIFGGIFTSLLSLSYLLFNNVNIVGASGAISVLLGFLSFYDRASAKGLFIALMLMSFAPLLLGANVAWYAHLFGFIVGFGAGFLRKKYGIF